jgi:hypothetical protein
MFDCAPVAAELGRVGPSGSELRGHGPVVDLVTQDGECQPVAGIVGIGLRAARDRTDVAQPGQAWEARVIEQGRRGVR